MTNKIKGEFFKTIKYSKLWILNGIVLISLLLLFLWMAYFSGENIRQDFLHSSTCAGIYGLTIFVTIFHKIWGILYGFLIVNIDFTENRKDYFTPIMGRNEFWACKLIVSTITSFVMVTLSYILPYMISGILSGSGHNTMSIPIVITQLLFVWCMTTGSIVLGMIAAIWIKDVIPVIVIVSLMEFFPAMYPDIIVDIWNRTDGYWYYSNLLLPMKEQLSGLQNFHFSLSDEFDGINGFIIWFLLYIILIMFSFAIIKKKDL